MKYQSKRYQKRIWDIVPECSIKQNMWNHVILFKHWHLTMSFSKLFFECVSFKIKIVYLFVVLSSRLSVFGIEIVIIYCVMDCHSFTFLCFWLSCHDFILAIFVFALCLLQLILVHLMIMYLLRLILVFLMIFYSGLWLWFPLLFNYFLYSCNLMHVKQDV